MTSALSYGRLLDRLAIDAEREDVSAAEDVARARFLKDCLALVPQVYKTRHFYAQLLTAIRNDAAGACMSVGEKESILATLDEAHDAVIWGEKA